MLSIAQRVFVVRLLIPVHKKKLPPMSRNIHLLNWLGNHFQKLMHKIAQANVRGMHTSLQGLQHIDEGM